VDHLDECAAEVLRDLLHDVVPHLADQHLLAALIFPPCRADPFLKFRIVQRVQAERFRFVENFFLLLGDLLLLFRRRVEPILADAERLVHEVVVDVRDEVFRHVLALCDEELDAVILEDDRVHDADDFAFTGRRPLRRCHLQTVERGIFEMVVLTHEPEGTDLLHIAAESGKDGIVSVTLDPHFDLFLPTVADFDVAQLEVHFPRARRSVQLESGNVQ